MENDPGACFKYRYVPPFLMDRQRHQHHIHAEAMFDNSAWLLIIAVRSPISDWDFPLVEDTRECLPSVWHKHRLHNRTSNRACLCPLAHHNCSMKIQNIAVSALT